MKISAFILFLAIVMFGSNGCSTLPEYSQDSSPPLRTISDEEMKSSVFFDPDPMEGFNRGVYKFNYHFDNYLFLPITRSYEYIMPEYAQDRVSDFVDNFSEFRNFCNNLYQLKMVNSGITLARFIINSTVGIVGLWDVATPIGLHSKPEDMGQSMGYYGVGAGPYLILPALGPSNLRDGAGFLGDYVVNTYTGPFYWIQNNALEWSYYGVYSVDTRRRIPFRYYSTDSPFEYELVRLAYGIKRNMDIDR